MVLLLGLRQGGVQPGGDRVASARAPGRHDQAGYGEPENNEQNGEDRQDHVHAHQVPVDGEQNGYYGMSGMCFDITWLQ
jgi:hypothetical protein